MMANKVIRTKEKYEEEKFQTFTVFEFGLDLLMRFFMIKAYRSLLRMTIES